MNGNGMSADSQNYVLGSLSDDCIEQLLDSCKRQLITCCIRVQSDAGEGQIEIRSGAVEDARFGDKRGKDAISAMNALRAGDYELSQRLPGLSGELGPATFEGHTSQVELIKVMQHCEQNALSCTVTVKRGSDEAQIHYQLGEVGNVFFNGKRDDDSIVEVMDMKDASFRVSAPPLDLAEGTWPGIARTAAPPPAVKAAPAPVRTAAATPAPAPRPAATPAPTPMAVKAVTAPPPVKAVTAPPPAKAVTAAPPAKAVTAAPPAKAVTAPPAKAAPQAAPAKAAPQAAPAKATPARKAAAPAPVETAMVADSTEKDIQVPAVLALWQRLPTPAKAGIAVVVTIALLVLLRLFV